MWHYSSLTLFVYLNIGSWIHTASGASANLDFNRNGSIQSGTVNVDLSVPQDLDTLDIFQASILIDWQNLVFDGGHIGEGLEAFSSPVSITCAGQ
jgi:hypothetical protein